MESIMKSTCYYYNDIKLEFERVTLKEIKSLEVSEKSLFLKMTSHLYRFKDKRIQMTLVRNGAHQGFRRKGNGGGNTTLLTRGEKESDTHQINKEVIAEMNELTIEFNYEKVKLFIQKAEMEYGIMCNGSYYEADIYFKLDHTEPAEYCKLWNEELYFELFHTCRVDYKKAEDFAIDGKTLFEYKIPSYLNVVSNISEEGLVKRAKSLRNTYENNSIRGCLICKAREESLQHWKLSSNGNWTCKIGDERFTIIESRYGHNYGIMYGKKKPLWEYNNKKFTSVEEAKRIADYVAFRLYNNEKI